MAARESMLQVHGGHRGKDRLSVRSHKDVGPKVSDASVFSVDELSDLDMTSHTGVFKDCRRSRACCIMLYVWLFLFCLGCLAAILAVACLIFLPYVKAKKFLDATCYPVQLQATADLACACGKRCKSSYPCVTIFVEVNGTSELNPRSFLHEHEGHLNRQVSDSSL